MTDFAVRLRRATMPEHRNAETRTFITRLIAGVVPRAGFAALTAQYLVVYRELEAASLLMRADPVAAAFADPALDRLSALEADLAHLNGPGWQTAVQPTGAALRYARRLRELCHASPAHFIAHHYVRYLGDLSGGLLVGRAVAETYGLDGAGVAFYRFDRIPDAREYKTAYRARLDALPYAEDELAAIVREARTAFGLNAEIFQELGELYPDDLASVASPG